MIGDEEVVLQGELVEGPQKLLSGRFSVYLAPGDRVVMSVRIEGSEEDQRWVVPKTLLKMMSRSMGMNPLDALMAQKGK